MVIFEPSASENNRHHFSSRYRRLCLNLRLSCRGAVTRIVLADHGDRCPFLLCVYIRKPFEGRYVPTQAYRKQCPAISLTTKAVGDTDVALVAAVMSSDIATSAATEQVYSQIATRLCREGLLIAQERIFGGLDSFDAIAAARAVALQKDKIPVDGPFTYIQGSRSPGDGLLGVIVHAVRANSLTDYRILHDDGIPCGRIYRHKGQTSIVIQNCCCRSDSQNGATSAPDAARQTIERAERLLRENGASYNQVVRTWFYLRDILAWYPQFNDIRNAMYHDFGMMPQPGNSQLRLPASTGIGAVTQSAAHVAIDLLAILGEDGQTPHIKCLNNHAQLEAFRYGSAFSRAVRLSSSNRSSVYVSGTAAIDDRGQSQFPGDSRRQISATLDTIESLLAQERLTLRDFVSATVFVKEMAAIPIYREMMQQRGLADFPAVCVAADVCREELLFEVDGEVASPRSSDSRRT